MSNKVVYILNGDLVANIQSDSPIPRRGDLISFHSNVGSKDSMLLGNKFVVVSVRHKVNITPGDEDPGNTIVVTINPVKTGKN